MATALVHENCEASDVDEICRADSSQQLLPPHDAKEEEARDEQGVGYRRQNSIGPLLPIGLVHSSSLRRTAP
jgi:hypothetical protein